MLEKLHNLAIRLIWVQPLAVVVGLLALLAVAFLAVGQGDLTDRYLIPAVLLFCWCLLVFSLVGMFRVAPPAVEEHTGFFRRLRIRIQRFLRFLLALAFLALTIALVFLSYRLVVLGIG